MTLAAGVVLLVVFALWEVAYTRRGASPLVPPHLFSHASFTGGVVLALVYFAAFTSIFFTLSILWQTGLGHSALESGVVSIPFALGSIIASSQSNKLAERLGRTVLVIGAGLLSVGLIWLWLVLRSSDGAALTHWDLLPPLLIAGLGNGAFIAPNAQFIIATVDRAEAGAASGVVSTVQRVGSAVGIAIIGSVLFGSLVITGPDSVAPGFTHAAGNAMAVSAAFSVAALLLVFALPKRTGGHGPAAPACRGRRGGSGPHGLTPGCARSERFWPRLRGRDLSDPGQVLLGVDVLEGDGRQHDPHRGRVEGLEETADGRARAAVGARGRDDPPGAARRGGELQREHLPVGPVGDDQVDAGEGGEQDRDGRARGRCVARERGDRLGTGLERRGQPGHERSGRTAARRVLAHEPHGSAHPALGPDDDDREVRRHGRERDVEQAPPVELGLELVAAEATGPAAREDDDPGGRHRQDGAGRSGAGRVEPGVTRAPIIGASLACASAHSDSGSEPATIPQPAKSRTRRRSVSSRIPQRRAMPHSPAPVASVQPTGPA